jgi:hypothetical protein
VQQALSFNVFNIKTHNTEKSYSQDHSEQTQHDEQMNGFKTANRGTAAII